MSLAGIVERALRHDAQQKAPELLGLLEHPSAPDCRVADFWRLLDGDKREIVAEPLTWGGIGLWRAP